MKKLSYWIAPCLCASLYFADFAQVARAEGVDDSPADAEARPGGGGGAPHAAPAPHVSAPPARPAAPAPRPAAPAAPHQGTVPQMNRPAPRNMSPRQAPSPEAAQARQAAQQQQATRENAARQEAAQRSQNARVEAAKERASDNAERAQNGAANRNQAAERAHEAAQTQQAATEREERNRAAVNAEQNRAAQAQERAREAQGNRQNEAAQNQERAREAQTDRREEMQNRAAENQDRMKEAQDRAREAQANRQSEAAQNLNRQREELQNRAADNRERMQDAQERNRENLANRAAENQQRVQDAQERARANVANNQDRVRAAQQRAQEAQANLRNRVSENVEQRREAYQNARQLAAEARRPFLERPDSQFRPEFNEIRRDQALQNRWSGWGAWNQAAAVNNARANAQRIALATNYQRAVNWSYQPSYWGSRPWWSANANHSWYTGSWNYGWNRNWYGRQNWYSPGAWPGYVVRDNGIGNGIAWGLAGWGLGSLIYDSGYEVYSNPYSPAAYEYGDTTIDYRQPFTTIASNYPTGDEERSKTSAEKSTAALERSRQSFRDGDYMAALKADDESISYEPGDSSLHEYRALILFALSRYGDAAGVLNSILASGPGWDRNTMIAFYPDEKVYDDQLAKLEDYSRNKPDAADAHFVLGYHYMVSGNLEGAGHEFDQVVALQPRDTIAKQLRDLVHSSVKDPDAAVPSQPVEGADRPLTDSVEPERLIGTWSTDRGNAGTVTLNLQDDGQFRWKFDNKGAKGTELKGTYNIDDRGLLVLKSDSSQMVGEISMPKDNQLVFVLAGGPDGDPGLKFNRE